MTIKKRSIANFVELFSRKSIAAIIAVASISSPLQLLAQPPWGDGPPPWMNRDGGGPPGGDGGGRDRSSRGGGEGGGGWRGGRGGGGFDPSRMLKQLDTNGNQMIDLDEMQGPARFMLERMARDNPTIDLTKPVPLAKVTEAMESRMRGGGGETSEDSDAGATETPPLVAGFGVSASPEPLPGFGKDGDKFSVKVEERDLKEASDRISRYDKNKDGQLDEAELKDGRWTDSPMQYDRNRDKKLNKQELAVRYARKRLSSEDTAKSKDAPAANANAARNDNGDKVEVVSPWKAQAHYRIIPKAGKLANVQGIQGWFTTSDIDGDGQVMMHEFASNWDDSTIEEFRRFDTNFDGTITTSELLASVKNGVMRGSGGGSNSVSVSTGMTSGTQSGNSSGSGGAGFNSEGVEEKWIKWLEKAMTQLDRDKNFRITVDEWPPSNGEFNATDTNQDGVISMLEWHLIRKSRK